MISNRRRQQAAAPVSRWSLHRRLCRTEIPATGNTMLLQIAALLPVRLTKRNPSPLLEYGSQPKQHACSTTVLLLMSCRRHPPPKSFHNRPPTAARCNQHALPITSPTHPCAAGERSDRTASVGVLFSPYTLPCGSHLHPSRS